MRCVSEKIFHDVANGCIAIQVGLSVKKLRWNFGLTDFKGSFDKPLCDPNLRFVSEIIFHVKVNGCIAVRVGLSV